MAVAIDLLKEPFEVNFTGNPITYSFALSPYGFVERKQDYKILLTVEREVGTLSGIFYPIREQLFYPKDDGSVTMNISSIADAFLKFYTPRYEQVDPQLVRDQSLRFRVQALVQLNGIQIGTTIVSNPVMIIKGGLCYERNNASVFFTNYILGKPLDFYVDYEGVTPTERKFLTWIYPNNNNKTQYIRFTIVRENGTNNHWDFPITIPAYKWAIYQAYINLTFLVNKTQDAALLADLNAQRIQRFNIAIFDQDAIIICSGLNYEVNYRNALYPAKQLLYTSSTGALQSLIVFGEIEKSGEYVTSSASVVPPPSGFRNSILVANTVQLQNTEVEKFTGSTTFIKLPQLENLRDLLLSRNVLEDRDGQFVPVSINKKTIKFWSNRDSLYSMQFEWSNAFENRFYTPPDLLNTAGATCPALTNFIVKQIAKNKLQVLWAMPDPYDILQVAIDNGTTIATMTLSGNTGSQEVFFTNPAVAPATAAIIIQGRVICNPDSDPISAGMHSTVNLNAYANTDPVATDDTYQLTAGYSTPQILTGSALDNDWDPDGDAIEAVVAAGPTTQGGAFAIDAAGIVTYTPPSALYNGQDSFQYTIQESADHTSQATGTIRINVGNIGLGGSIFIKLIVRNILTVNSGIHINASADFIIGFFADPACTIAKDLTGLNISVNVETTYKKTLISNGAVLTSITGPLVFAASSIEMPIYSGIFFHQQIGGVSINNFREERSFIVKPGAGYIPV